MFPLPSISCDVLTDKEVYYPGQQITGKVQCIFKSEARVKSIRINLEGIGRVKFGIKNPIINDERYLQMTKEITTEQEVFSPGTYAFPYTLELPKKMPSTVMLQHGSICYHITAIIDAGSERAEKGSRKICIGPHIDLNEYSACKIPVTRSETKRDMFDVFKTSMLTIDVRLPQSGYVPSQPIQFDAKVKNLSMVDVVAVRFKLLQTIKIIAHEYEQQYFKELGEEVEVPDSAVLTGNEKNWNVRLQIPPETSAPNLCGCSIIKVFCEIVGTVVLPFPLRDLRIRVPFYLGTVPLRNSATA